MSNNLKALKSGIWYTVSTFLVKSIGFITTPIFARLLTKAEFGDFNNYTSWMSILTIFVTMDLESTLISARFDFKDRFDEYILSVLTLSTVSAVAWIGIMNFFSEVFVGFFSLKQLYINVMLVYLLFLPAINMFQAKERYLYKYKKTVIISLTLALSTALLSVLLVVCMTDKLFGRILGAAVPTIIIGLLLYIYFVRKGRKVDLGYWKYAISICLPFIPHLLSMTALNSTDRVMINRWCGSEDTALYSLAYSCGAIITILLTSLNKAYGPWLAEKIVENKLGEIRKFSKIYISAFVLAAVGLMLISPEVLLVLGGEKYREAIYVMTPVTMGCVCQFIYTMFVNIEQLKKKTVGMAIASVIAAGTNLLLNWIFIPRVGYLAAAYTTLVGYLVLLSIHMYLVYKLRLNGAYSYRFVGVAVFVGIIMMVLITLLYSNNVIRYIAIALYFLSLTFLLFKFKDKVIALAKRN